MSSRLEVYQLIMYSTSTSPGDTIPLSIIKQLKPIMAPFYCSIVNYSLYGSTFPSVFKHAEITPLLKKANFNKLYYYRPISQMPLLSKIIENISRQIIDY